MGAMHLWIHHVLHECVCHPNRGRGDKERQSEDTPYPTWPESMTPNGKSEKNTANQTAKLADVGCDQNLPNSSAQLARISDSLGAEHLKRPHHSDDSSEQTYQRAKLKPGTDLCESFARVM